MNRYLPDGSAILDATGKQWPVDTAHPLPLPEGIKNFWDGGGFVSVVFGGNGVWQNGSNDGAGCTHWLARRPLPEIPKPKTQEELDEEAFEKCWRGMLDGRGWHFRHIETVWKAAIAYARKGQQ